MSLKSIFIIHNRLVLLWFCLLFSSSLLASETPIASIKTTSGQDDRGEFRLEYIVLNNQANQKINHKLFEDLVSDKQCLPDASQKNKMHYRSKIEIKTVNQALLSFVSSDDSYCGGPYPDAGLQFSTYDIKHVKKINLMDEIKDGDQFKKYLAKQFQNQPTASIPEDCKQVLNTEDLLNTDFQFFIDNQTIIIRQDYPHVTRACEFNVTFHCRDIEPFLKNESILSSYCSAKYRYEK